jgi:hypothetical protein
VFYLRPKKKILLIREILLEVNKHLAIPKKTKEIYIKVFTPPIAPLDPRGFLRGKREGMRGQCPLPSISEGGKGGGRGEMVKVSFTIQTHTCLRDN